MDKTSGEKTMSTISLTTLTDNELEHFAKILKLYFPWLGTDSNEISGSEVIEELDNLYDSLPKQED
jgi:hypothetical protein